MEIQKQDELERYFHKDRGWQVRERCQRDNVDYSVSYALIKGPLALP